MTSRALGRICLLLKSLNQFSLLVNKNAAKTINLTYVISTCNLNEFDSKTETASTCQLLSVFVADRFHLVH